MTLLGYYCIFYAFLCFLWSPQSRCHGFNRHGWYSLIHRILFTLFISFTPLYLPPFLLPISLYSPPSYIPLHLLTLTELLTSTPNPNPTHIYNPNPTYMYILYIPLFPLISPTHRDWYRPSLPYSSSSWCKISLSDRLQLIFTSTTKQSKNITIDTNIW